MSFIILVELSNNVLSKQRGESMAWWHFWRNRTLESCITLEKQFEEDGINGVKFDDTIYYKPEKRELDHFLMLYRDFKLPSLPGYSKAFNCNHFAISLKAYIHEAYAYNQKDAKANWAFFTVTIRGRYSDTKEGHVINLCITRDNEFIYIEPQTGLIIADWYTDDMSKVEVR